MANYSIERKNYNKLTAQIARNVIKKKILEIRTRGATAVDELIDDLWEKSVKSQKSPQNRFVNSKITPLIEKNRSKWRNFIIELAGRFDADCLSVLGVDLIYGGIMTSSAGNTAWASVVSVEHKSPRAFAEIISKGRNRGTMVWILRGREAFSSETLRTCKYFPDCAFVLASNQDFNATVFWGAKNVLVLLKKEDKNAEKELLRQGIPYIFADGNDPIFDVRGKGSGVILPSLPPALTSFIESPRLPITIDNPTICLNSVEYLLSNGKSSTIPYYFA